MTRILLAEDDEISQEIVKQVLSVLDDLEVTVVSSVRLIGASGTRTITPPFPNSDAGELPYAFVAIT